MTSPDASASQATAVVRPGAPAWLRTTVDLGRWLDRTPCSPSNLGDRIASALHERRRKVAAADPQWAAIEARRETGRPGFSKLLDEDLNWGHFETQRDIERRLVPDPWFMPAVRAAQDVKLGRIAVKLVGAVDRLRRGWDESEAYNLCRALPVRVGEQLAWLADNAHGWPGVQAGYADEEEWFAEVRHHARILTTGGYGEPGRDDELLTTWADARSLADAAANQGPDDQAGAASSSTSLAEVRAEGAWRTMVAAEADANAAVIASMRWVAEHIHQLWD